MSFENTFCPSPWFHMRITTTGKYEYCRWNEFSIEKSAIPGNVRTHSVTEYFQESLAPIRQELLNGNIPGSCSDCHVMENYGKVSGRERQLLKIGAQPVFFAKSLASSPFVPAFDYSNLHNGRTLEYVQDWQIDLGNYCNSACIFCRPVSSSKLASEFKKIGLITEVPSATWANDSNLVDKFCNDMLESSQIRYLHFIGGETIITPAFRQILSKVVNSNRAREITIGFTTNLTVWDQEVVELLRNFKQVNLGVSIETFTALNDYVRWPSRISDVKNTLVRWQEECKQNSWLMQLRITPTCLTIHELITVYDYAWQHELPVESTNFLNEPSCLKISVLPVEYRVSIIRQLEDWIARCNLQHDQRIVNVRSPSTVREYLQQEVVSYIQYLKEMPDDSAELVDLVKYLKLLEQSRKNSVLDYLPQYEKLLRTSGY